MLNLSRLLLPIPREHLGDVPCHRLLCHLGEDERSGRVVQRAPDGVNEAVVVVAVNVVDVAGTVNAPSFEVDLQGGGTVGELETKTHGGLSIAR
jgi:hypothetical protein